MQSPDTSSEEWIAQAPSKCGHGSCEPLPLADFGTVTFSRATALGRAAAAINSSALTPTAITLTEAGPGFASAIPSVLIASGTAFSVNFKQVPGLPGGHPAPPLASDHLRPAVPADVARMSSAGQSEMRTSLTP